MSQFCRADVKEQRMLFLITNDILEHLPNKHITAYQENVRASSKCPVYTGRALYNMKSVSVTVFMVPHDAFAANFPRKHCFHHVYSGPDAAMLNRKVIKIGKH